MIRLGLLLFVVTLVGARNTGFDVPMPDGRIVGGKDASISQYPHQISMHYNGRHRCGGSIYTSNIIITAAHCVVGTNASLMKIVAGITKLSEKNQELGVVEYIMHPNYKTSNQDYDIAILVLSGFFKLNSNLQSIKLARTRPPHGSELTVTGWGTLAEGGSIPDQLQQVHVNLVDNYNCKQSYKYMLTARMMCAGVLGGGKDACQGDSGGPLIHNNELVGVVSWGIGCARKGYPGVYASVPDLHDWIVKTSNENEIELSDEKK